MKSILTPAFVLLDAFGQQPSLAPLVRFTITEGAHQLRRGYDGAAPERSPHEWVRIVSLEPRVPE